MLELTAAMAVAGVLATVAWPGLQGVVWRTRRADAVLATFQVQLAQARHRGLAPTYGSLEDLGLPGLSPEGHYGLSIGSYDAEGYDLTARATGAQARDTACRFMRLRLRNATPDYTSGPDPDAANDAAANQRCWNR